MSSDSIFGDEQRRNQPQAALAATDPDVRSRQILEALQGIELAVKQQHVRLTVEDGIKIAFGFLLFSLIAGVVMWLVIVFLLGGLVGVSHLFGHG